MMVHNTQKERTKIQDIKLNTVVPNVIMNANDKIILETMYQTHNSLSYVYILAVHKLQNSNNYNAVAETEIATFKNSEDARMYFETLKQVAEYQKKNMSKLYEAVQEVNSDIIEKFKTR